MTDKEALLAMLKRVGVELDCDRSSQDDVRAYSAEAWQEGDFVNLSGDYANAHFKFDDAGNLIDLKILS